MRLLPVLLVLGACSTAAPQLGGVDPSDLAAIPLTPGASDAVVPIGDDALPLLLDVPGDLSAEVPLVIAMPYAGAPEASAREYRSLLARPGLARLGAIVIVPVAITATWDTPAATSTIASLVRAAIEAWPIDPDRVVVTGYSNGGNGTWAQAALYPELYSAAIPMGSYAPTAPPTGVPLYILHGEDDELFPVGRARAAAEAADAAGGQVEFEALPFSHFQAGRYAEALDRAAAWVEAEVWTAE